MNPTYSCPECDEFKTSFRVFLSLHLKSKHCYACPYICEFCQYSCSEPAILKEHEEIHKLVDKKCSYCFYCASSSEDLVSHESSCTERVNSVGTSTTSELRAFRKEKPICVIESVQSLSNSTPVKDNICVSSCHMCPLKFEADFLLKIHLQSKHAQGKWLDCVNCSFRGTDKNELIEHRRTTHRIVYYFCSVCDYSTYSTTNIQRHEASHRNIKDKCCLICDFKTTHRGYLDKHMKNVHSGPADNARVCEICGNIYNRKSGLLIHMRKMHLLNVPIHSCALCPYKTKKFSDLRRHVKRFHGN